jgi:hypothetical protein
VGNGLNNSRDQNNVIYGFHSATTAYIDVTGYDNAKFTLSTAGTQGIRLMYNDAKITIETNSSSTSYIQSLSTMPKIATIKTKNISGLTAITVSAIDFVKEHMPASTTAFNVSSAISGTVNYDRTFPTDKRSTVCLPFALTKSEAESAGTFYELESVDNGVLKFTEVAETKAYTPYVFEAKTANPFANLTNKEIVATPVASSDYATTVGGYTFQGTLAHQNVPNGAYGYNANTGAFSKATSDAVTIDAFRAYITSTSGARELKCVFGDETTGIEEVQPMQQVTDDVMYNLVGMRVGAGHKGLVIKNGKKYFIK